MNKIKKNDIVFATAGKDKGKKGKVLKVFYTEGKAIVEGINCVKKHTRKTREDKQGGIIEKENPIRISNLMVLCGNCNHPSRIGIAQTADGNRARFCKKCKELI